MPDADPLDRRSFYADDEDDGADYELEPIDHHVLEHERRQGQEAVRHAESAVDVDQVYREMGGATDWEPSFQKLRLRFGVKHLLIGITAVALLLGLLRGGLLNGSAFAVLILLITVGLAAANAWFGWRERRKQQRALRRREHELAASRGEPVEPFDEQEDTLEALLAEFGADARNAITGLRFSTAELVGGLVTAAILLALPKLLGIDNAWAVMALLMIFGMVGVVTGMIVPPRMVVGGWLLALAGYFFLSMTIFVARSLGFAG